MSRSPHRALRLAALSAIALLVASTPARADDHAVATELFNAGRDLMKDGDYAAACPKLAESVRLDPTVGALAKLAACEEHEKQLVRARAHWEQALNLARSLGDSRAGEVAEALARVDRVVPKVVFAATGPLPKDTVLRVDDLSLGAGSVGVSIPVEPGKHAVSVTAPGAAPWSTSIDVNADGAAVTVTIPALEPAAPVTGPVAPPEPAPVAVVPPPVAPPPRAEAPLSPFRIAALAAGGAGVVAAGVGTVLGVQAITQQSNAHCQGTVCGDTNQAAELTRAKDSASGATIAFVVTGALVAGGIVLWVVSPTSSARVGGVYVAPAVGGIVAGGHWD